MRRTSPVTVEWRHLLAVGAVYALLMSGYVAWRAERSTDYRDFWRNARVFLERGEIASGAVTPAGQGAPTPAGTDGPNIGRTTPPNAEAAGDTAATAAAGIPGAETASEETPSAEKPSAEAPAAEDPERRFEGVHNYLPFFTLFMAPWGLLPLPVAIVVFTLLSLTLFGIAVVLVDVMIQGRLGAQPSPATLLALALIFPYVHSCVTVGAVGLLLLFLVVAAWFLLERRQEWVAGMALGLAALIKLLPLVMIGYCLLRGRWRAVAGSTVVLLGLGCGLPLATVGLGETLAAHRAFLESAAAHSAWKTIFSDSPEKTKFNNNALPMVLRRLLSPVNANPQEGQPALLVNLTDLPRPAILGIYLLLAAALLGGSVWAALRGLAEPAFGAWAALMLLASPLVWTHYLPLAYPALAVLAVRWQSHVADGRRPPWHVAAALGIWGIAILLLAWPAARGAGAQVAGVLAVWAALVWDAQERGASSPDKS